MTSGCNLRYDGKVYHQGYPAAMAHIRAGYSIGQRGLLECSVCGGDPCRHGTRAVHSLLVNFVRASSRAARSSPPVIASGVRP